MKLHERILANIAMIPIAIVGLIVLGALLAFDWITGELENDNGG